MTLADHITIARRFQRSIRLDTDFERPDALHGFVCQRSTADSLVGMARQIAETSQRAFTWTGPYGGGKSSLAVVLAALLGAKGRIRDAATQAVGSKTAQQLQELLKPTRDGWLIVPVTGRRSNPAFDISASLEHARRKAGAGRGRPRQEIRSARELIERLVEEAAARPRDGVLVIIDELGKFLEQAALENRDIYFFQELAEVACRAKGRLVLVGILHQAFEQYANRLGSEARDEWAKIQGRFVDIPLVARADETVDLLGRAIVSDRRTLEITKCSVAIANSIRIRRPSTPGDFAARLDRCRPLHPVTAVVLGPMSRRRFGQNERSVFGFLTSAEPSGFREFLQSTPDNRNVLFGPERFWDYLRTNLEPAILASADSHRWAQGADAVERCEARGSALHVLLAKAIALIDMFRNGSGLAADRSTLGACAEDAPSKEVDAALADLERWSVAVFRKHLDAWAIYAGSDFDIDVAVSSASAKLEGLDLRRLARLVGLQPVLAKRHYHETGSFRWFHASMVHLASLRDLKFGEDDAAGHFILALPVANEDLKVATLECRTWSQTVQDNLVAVGVPRNARRIVELGKELTALEAVSSGRPELEGDSVARREIHARIAAVSSELEEELRAGFAEADWFSAGEKVEFRGIASIPRLASDLADRRYPQAPHIYSELVNRQKPSSNTQAGIRDLLHAMLTGADTAALGIEGYPVHRGFYETILAPAGLHRKSGETFQFGRPTRGKIGSTYQAMWDAANAVFATSETPISLGQLYKAWEAPPYGVRRGIMPILALAYILANRSRFALYGAGAFQSDIDLYLVDLLLQDENLVALRRVDMSGSRGTLFSGFAQAAERVLKLSCGHDPLEVARQLVKFVRELPPWTQKTLSISREASEVRRVLLRADDPHKALFVDLPMIFGGNEPSSAVKGLEVALRELDSAFSCMMDDLVAKMLKALGHTGELQELHERAKIVTELSGDLRLDAFASRLSTYTGGLGDFEAIASMSLNRPTRDWTDRDPDQAGLALAELALKFRRAETLARVKGRQPICEAVAFVIGTGESGREIVAEFEVKKSDRPKIAAIVESVDKILSKSGAERSVRLAVLAELGLAAIDL